MLAKNHLFKLIPFWLFIIFFKSAASLHYTLFPILSERFFPVWVAGALVSLEAFIQMLLDVPAGYFLDRFGYIRSLLFSTSCFLLGVLLFSFGLQPWTILGSLFFSLVGWLFFNPGIDAYILVQTKREFAGRSIALRDITASAGVVIGMTLLPFVLDKDGVILASLLGVFFCLALFFLMRAPKDTASIKQHAREGKESFFIRRRFIHHVLASLNTFRPVSLMLMMQRFSAALFYGILWFVVPLMIANMAHTGPLSFGLVVFDFSILVTGYILGRLTDRWEKRWLVFCGMSLFSVCALLLGFHFGILFVLLGFFATTGDEMASISLWAWLDELDTQHREDGLLSGALTLAEDLGWTVGPLIAGFLFVPFGPTWTILTGACMITLAWIASTIFMLQSPRPKPSIPAHIFASYPRHKPHKR